MKLSDYDEWGLAITSFPVNKKLGNKLNWDLAILHLKFFRFFPHSNTNLTVDAPLRWRSTLSLDRAYVDARDFHYSHIRTGQQVKNYKSTILTGDTRKIFVSNI